MELPNAKNNLNGDNWRFKKTCQPIEREFFSSHGSKKKSKGLKSGDSATIKYVNYAHNPD